MDSSSFMYFPSSRPVKTEKVIVTKWDFEKQKRTLNKRAIARIRQDKFRDFDNMTDSLYEDAVNRISNCHTSARIKQVKADKIAHHNLLDKLIQLYINQSKDLECLD